MKRDHINVLEELSLELEGVTSLLLAVSDALRYGAYNEKAYVDGVDMLLREMQDITNRYNQTVDDIVHNRGIEQ